MTPRDRILQRVRSALGHAEEAAPPVRLRVPDVSLENRIASMATRLEALAGRFVRVESPSAAGAWVRQTIENRTAIVSNAPYLKECGITRLPGVRSGITERASLQELCATADIGITSADYALADTGSLVMLSSPGEARMISLLPPAHIAVVPSSRLLTGLDELFLLVPDPAAVSSSMVLITGPSRTADIEQILVRGVHGPGQITVVLVG